MSLDPRIWKACAGSGKIPDVGSLVYYFPQGHAEQSSSPPDFSAVRITNPFSLCRVVAVHLSANPVTDEVFAKIRLGPIPSSALAAGRDFSVGGVGISGDDVVSFAKVLTPSDANNGGGFSVPRFCADSIFPKLYFDADPPVQNVSMTDVHGNRWVFRHVYRGTPKRHLLTTGWSRFVNSKKLIAGDSVVFIKNGDGNLFVGIRRTGRSFGNPDYMKMDENSNVGSKDVFSRNVKGRVPAESIVEAVRLMEMEREFEVLYYPRTGLPEFAVEKELVDKSLRVFWREGMRVKMSVETEDSARMTWLQGRLRCKDIKDSGPWSHSPWRMLQVTWDEPEVLSHVRAVSPWQVELVSTSPDLHMPFPAMKKLKLPHDIELPNEGHAKILFPRSVTSGMKMGNLTSVFSNPTTFPAGMQGARHDFCVPSLSSFVHGNTHQIFSDNLYGINMPEEFNTSQSESASPPSQESVHNHGLELLGVPGGNHTRKVSKGSFLLFGQIINMDQSDDSVNEEFVVNEGVQSLEVSLSSPNDLLLDGVDVQHQRISSVESCTL